MLISSISLCIMFIKKTWFSYVTSCTTNLGEVAHQVAAISVNFGENVEKKWFHVKVQRLVIEEEFSQQTKVLAVDLQQRWYTDNELLSKIHPQKNLVLN